MLVCRALRPYSSNTLLCGLLQVLSVSPELQRSGEVTKVTAYTSDLIELVSGVCPVSALQPPEHTGGTHIPSSATQHITVLHAAQMPAVLLPVLHGTPVRSSALDGWGVMARRCT